MTLEKISNPSSCRQTRVASGVALRAEAVQRSYIATNAFPRSLMVGSLRHAAVSPGPTGMQPTSSFPSLQRREKCSNANERKKAIIRLTNSQDSEFYFYSIQQWPHG